MVSSVRKERVARRTLKRNPMGLRHRTTRSGVIAVAGSAVFIGFLAWPMLFTSSGLAGDWVGHLWEVWKQETNLSHNHAPSLFVSGGNTVFLPLFGYYGGTLFALSGALSLGLGSAVRSYVVFWLLGFAAAYGGWFWLARMAGLGRWLAHVPGFVFITSGYYLTLIYARGDFAEFSGVSEIPLMVASGLSVLFAKRLRPLPALALAGSTLVFFGSHNITVLWGSSVLVLLSAVLIAAVPQARRRITRAGVARVAVLAVPAALISAWYLLPAIAYGSRTWVSTGLGMGLAHNLYHTKPLVSAGHLFTFSRSSVTVEVTDFVLALPVLALIWVAASIVLSWRVSDPSVWRRVLVIAAGSTLVLVVMMAHPRLILHLPRPYQLIQFTYRLESYVLLSLCGAMLAALVLLGRSGSRAGRIWLYTVVTVLVASGIGAIQQVDTHPTVVHDRDLALNDKSEPVHRHILDQRLTYSDVTLPTIHPVGLPMVIFSPAAVHDDHLTVTVHLPPGSRLVDTNLAGAPYFVNLSGAQTVGRDDRRFMVLRLPPGSDGRPHTISLRSAEGLPIRLGRWVSFSSVAFWLILLVWTVIRSRLTPWRGT